MKVSPKKKATKKKNYMKKNREFFEYLGIQLFWHGNFLNLFNKHVLKLPEYAYYRQATLNQGL
jgi:hypothetical protein